MLKMTLTFIFTHLCLIGRQPIRIRSKEKTPMLVCHCNGISDRAIKRAIRKGAGTVADLRAACGAGSCCGSCAPVIRGLIRVEAASEPQKTESAVESQQTAAFA